MGKLENLSSLVVGVLMVGCLLMIVVNAVRNLLHPGEISGIGVWISLAKPGHLLLFVNSWLSLRSRRLAR